MGNSSLIEKITIKGRLVLDAPLRIGTGEGSKEIDVYVAKDRKQTPIIPGSSLAGVLRAAYKDAHPEDSSLLRLLFGREYDESDDNPLQSAIDVEDVKLEATEITVRDGVRINSFTGTAEDRSKHNFEAVERGSGGQVELAITIREEQEKEKQRAAVEAAAREIAAFLAQGICLGALSAKGFGRAHCPQVAVNFYDFSRAAAVKAWMLKQDYAMETIVHGEDKTYPPGYFVVDADFELNSSLLVRQEASETHGDMPVRVEQMQHRGKDEKPDYYIIPGTSLKGVLRSQAEKILARLGQDTSHLCDLMGGGANEKDKHKSRFIVEETYIEPQKGLHEHVQARNSIDRFTGGTMPGKLFGEKPLWQDEEGVPTVKIHFEIRPPRGNQERNDAHYTEWEYGLALFLLKDLSLGKVALGGGKSIGRGTLKGNHIRIRYSGEDYEIDQSGRVTGENAAEKAEKLESWAKSFLN